MKLPKLHSQTEDLLRAPIEI